MERGRQGDGLHLHRARAHTGVDLLTAKELLEKLQANTTVELRPLDFDNPRRVGEDLLRVGAVREAELVVGDRPTQAIAPPLPPPVFICPACRRTLKHRSECDVCGWLRF